LVELHVGAAHVPFWQTLEPQLVHTAPLIPHCVFVGVATHVVPLQQPLAQELAPHDGTTHAPLMHVRPVPHVVQLLPLAPQSC
jgi:hypothetical protein